MVSTPQDPKEPFNVEKAVFIGLTILTIIYSLRGILWLATH